MTAWPHERRRSGIFAPTSQRTTYCSDKAHEGQAAVYGRHDHHYLLRPEGGEEVLRKQPQEQEVCVPRNHNASPWRGAGVRSPVSLGCGVRGGRRGRCADGECRGEVGEKLLGDRQRNRYREGADRQREETSASRGMAREGDQR